LVGPGFVCGPSVPLQKRFNRFGPPHASVAFPAHVMLQSVEGAGPDPEAMKFPQSMTIRLGPSFGEDDLQHWEVYSVPAYMYPLVLQYAIQDSSVMATASV